jgi:type VI secretion system protein ImpH
MAAAQRNTPPPLIARLLSEPGAFDFFQAVRLLEEHLGERGHRAAVDGDALDSVTEAGGVHFDVLPSLAFPQRPIESVALDHSSQGTRADVKVAFLGLLGAAGTLPRHYTEIVLARQQARDTSLVDYLGTFEERAAAFFHRAWSKYRPAVAYDEHAAQRGEVDPVTTAFLALVGRLPRPRGEALTVDERLEAHFAGAFADRRRSAAGLAGLVRGLLHCDVTVEQFVGQWVDLDRSEWSRLGDGSGEGRQTRLGEESVLGTRVWAVDARVRIEAGPLDRERFRALWPGGEPVRIVRAAIRSYVGPLIDFDLFWHLAPEAPKALRLGGPQRLGRDTWLGWGAGRTPDLRVESRPYHESAGAPLGAHTQEL